jgi:hypothetical protein
LKPSYYRQAVANMHSLDVAEVESVEDVALFEEAQ